MLKARLRDGYVALKECLIDERTKAGMKQADLAQALGVRQSLISDIETGQRRCDVVELIAIAYALGRDPAEIIAMQGVRVPRRL
jgi:transcriptional regulator with XRE-family HTH domain